MPQSDLERLKALHAAIVATRQHIVDGKPGVYPKGYDKSDPEWPPAWDVSNAIYALKNAGVFPCDVADAAFDLIEEHCPTLKFSYGEDVDVDLWCQKVNKGQVDSLLRRVIGDLSGKIKILERLTPRAK